MRYISTRGAHSEGVSSAYAIKSGLASDGGLFMPEEIPTIDLDFIHELSALTYPQRVARVLSLYLTDYGYEELLRDAEEAYSKERFTPYPTPITRLSDRTYMLELWHGPTCAFKDMALQLMPRLFKRALDKCKEERTALILVATSGDTGKAALEGYRDLAGTKIQVFYPTDGVSLVQKKQMQTQEGDNLSVMGIRGNFDDAQNGVKAIFSDREIAEKLNERGVFLSSANSINWGRLVPQIVYYISAYCDMYRRGMISLGDSVDVCVPTGNFGNIFAAYIAKRMGVPIGRLVCASNKNNVLTDFLRSGVYCKNRRFYSTISPSMDILISSNLERLIYLLFGSERCKELMTQLNSVGEYRLHRDELLKIQEDFSGYYTEEEECAEALRDAYNKNDRLIDTHTAVAVSAAERYMSEEEAKDVMLVVSTASAYKFAGDVLLSLYGSKPENDLEAPALLFKKTGVAMPEPLRRTLEKELIHTRICDGDTDTMTKELFDFIR